MAHVIGNPNGVDFTVLEACLHVTLDVLSVTSSSTCDHVSLGILDPWNGKTVFNIRRRTPMAKLIQAFIDLTGKKEVHFTYRGQILSPTATAESLGMADDDIVSIDGRNLLAAVRSSPFFIFANCSYHKCIGLSNPLTAGCDRSRSKPGRRLVFG